MKIVKIQCQLFTDTQLIQVDRNVLYRGREFEEAQREHRNKSKQQFIEYFKRIKSEMGHIYLQFCNGSNDVLMAWRNYAAGVDSQILQALLKCVKSSLHTFSNAVGGESFSGDTHPLFSITAILRNGAIECRPTMIDITNAVNIVAKELIGVTKSIYRLSAQKGFNDLDSQVGISFYDDISLDHNVLDIVVRIMDGTAVCVASVAEKLLEWETYRSLWDMDKDSFLRRYSKTKQNSFEKDIDKYQSLESSIQKERSSIVIDFIQLNFSSLKSSLVAHSVEFREKLLGLLKKNTTSKVHSLLKFYEININELSKPIHSIEDLRNLSALVDNVEKKSVESDNDFAPLEKAFKILGRFGKEQSQDGNEEMMKQLKPQRNLLLDHILNAKVKIEKSKLIIKGEFNSKVSNHHEDMMKLCDRVDEAFTSEATSTTKDATAWIKSIKSDINMFRSDEKELMKGIDFFGMDLLDNQKLASAEANIVIMENILNSFHSWRTLFDKCLGLPISKLNLDEMDILSGQYIQDLTRTNRNIRNWEVWKEFRRNLDNFKSLLPLIQDLLNEGMRKRHFDSIGEALCREWTFSRDSFTINEMMILGMQRHSDLISELSAQASRELAVERTLMDMELRMLDSQLDFIAYKDTFKIIATDELFTMIEDDIASLQSMKSSNNAHSFQDQIEAQEINLNRTIEFIESFSAMQRQWVYLENIFISSGGDIGQQLPKEYGIFSQVNSQFKDMMMEMQNVRKLMSICRYDRIIVVEHMVRLMEEVQKSLDAYLETKRQIFPRFYFISDDDLLDIVGKSKEPEQLQKHMKKCFEGVSFTIFRFMNEESKYVATGVKATDGETLDFTTQVSIEGSVEVWLAKVLEEKKFTLKSRLDGSVKALKSCKRELWFKEWQGQTLITAGAISWTRGCERALDAIKSGKDKHSLRVYRKKQMSLIRNLTETLQDSSQQRSHRNKIVALITMEVHNRDVIEKLIRTGCQDPNDFTWTSQLRFYMENGSDVGTCIVRQTYCQLLYGYEYQGNNGRLVVTPLTDRCVLTLITAKFLHRGGNPLGPAGTGKTETVKDLAKNLAYFCVVSNCSDTMDYKSVGRIFSGLCQSGSWGCFDEFNRIKVEVISVVAMQVASIFDALRGNLSEFNFMGSNIHCSRDTGIFITMNPGYAGRSELPDNLKALMRPVAMMAPDLNLIAEVILAAEGFADSRVLAKKTITLYNLMQQQLSKQSHYDYGLRSIKGVLTMAGNLKQSLKQNEEELIVIRAIKSMNEPKFILDDLDLFHQLLGDIFPSRILEDNESVQLQGQIEKALEDNGLQKCEYIIKKTLQLAYSMKVRHCNMMIGASLTGKTSVWNTLASAKQRLPPDSDHHCTSVLKFIINPKALSVAELYGSYNTTTYEWRDGVISNIFKSCSENSKQNVEKWLIFDGPVDALWIESMNSVMDDNKILTLLNGDRISLTDSMALLFEVENLAVASPATVSRAGMIHVDNELGWRPLLYSWMQANLKMLQEHYNCFQDLCNKVRSISFITNSYQVFYSNMIALIVYYSIWTHL